MRLLREAVAALVVAGATAMGAVSALAQEGPPINWGGLYFGAGYGVQSTNIKGTYVTSPISHHDVSATSQVRNGFVGLQHQWGQFVFGVEASYGGTGFGDSWDSRSNGGTSSCLILTPGLQCRGRIDSVFTVGPRIGYAPSRNWLLFASGGYASGRIDTAVRNETTSTEIGRSSNRHDGWFLGGGVEYAYSANWSFGLEYQRLSLDTERHFENLAPFGNGCCIVNAQTRDMRGDADIFRMRTTFKLNRPEPVAEPMK